MLALPVCHMSPCSRSLFSLLSLPPVSVFSSDSLTHLPPCSPHLGQSAHPVCFLKQSCQLETTCADEACRGHFVQATTASQKRRFRTRQEVSLKRSAALSTFSDNSEVTTATATWRRPRPAAKMGLSIPMTQIFPCLHFSGKETKAHGFSGLSEVISAHTHWGSEYEFWILEPVNLLSRWSC